MSMFYNMQSRRITEEQFFQLLGQLTNGMLANSSSSGDKELNSYDVQMLLKEASGGLKQFLYENNVDVIDKIGNVL